MTESDASPGTATPGTPTPGTPTPGTQISGTQARGGPPWAVRVSAAAWVLTAVTVVLAWSSTSSGSEPTADDETLGTIRSQVGDSAVDTSGSAGGPVPPWLLLVVAVALVAVAVVLIIGKRWGRYPAVLAGVVSVVLLALAGRWETVPAMVLLVVGTVPLLLPGALRYLR